MSPVSVFAPSKCHRCKRYTAAAVLKRNDGVVGWSKKKKEEIGLLDLLDIGWQNHCLKITIVIYRHYSAKQQAKIYSR